MTEDQTYTYRGRSLEELVPKIREELGDDAVIVARRETTSGGVGGFFAKREIEVEVRPGESAQVAQAFREQLAAAQGRQEGGAEEPTADRPRPVVGPEVDALPSAADVSVDDLFPPAPPQARNLAALFNAGIDPQEPHDEGVRPPASETLRFAEPPSQEGVRPPASEALRSAGSGHGVRPPEDQPTGTFDFLDAAAVAPPSVPAPEPEPVAPQDRELFLEPPAPPAEAEAEPVEPEPEPEPAPEPVAPVDVAVAARDAAGQMASRGLRAELAEAVAAEALVGLLPFTPDAEPRALVLDALARRIPVLPLRRGPGVVGFVGAAGAGKTRCAARLAAAYVRHSDLPVVVVTLRSPDQGAELTRLLAPYGPDLHAVDSGAEGAATVAGLRGEALVIVDTVGVSPRNRAELQALGDELRALAPDELHLAVPATIGPDAARELVGGVRELGVGALALTHTDETEQLGTVIGLAIDSGLPLSYLARGQAVDAGLRPASATELAGCLLPS